MGYTIDLVEKYREYLLVSFVNDAHIHTIALLWYNSVGQQKISDKKKSFKPEKERERSSVWWIKNYEHIFKNDRKMCFGDYVIVITVTILLCSGSEWFPVLFVCFVRSVKMFCVQPPLVFGLIFLLHLSHAGRIKRWDKKHIELRLKWTKSRTVQSHCDFRSRRTK